MTEGQVRSSVVLSKSEVVRESLALIRTLPLDSLDDFVADHRTVSSGENYLRRALEALLDLGRHILAKGFGTAASEYKQIPVKLREKGVITAPVAEKFVQMAGYRNRIIHFYAEVTPQELYGILTEKLGDVVETLAALTSWVEEHPERVDRELSGP